jgi:predicted Zn-dependent protease
VIARVALAAVALVAGAAFVTWIGSSRAEERANAVAFAPPAAASKPAVAAALADARDAQRLGPDVPGELLEALLLRRSGRRAAADRLIDHATREEPQNAGAWLLLANTTRDRARFRRARAELARLNPLLSARGR